MILLTNSKLLTVRCFLISSTKPVVYRIRRKDTTTMAEEEKKPPHQFAVSNYDGIVIRCCIHCGLSHQMERDQQTGERMWNLILEVRGDETFAEPCPVESGSDDLFPYHHFILSNHHRPTGDRVVIRFCIRCGLSHLLDWTPLPSALGELVHYTREEPTYLSCWQPIKENERDSTISEPCSVKSGSDASKQRYLPVPKH
jgi:hypothetical protein